MEEFISYKFWKKGKHIAVYISECGGVAKLSNKGLYFPKEKLCISPSTIKKSRPVYPQVLVPHFLKPSNNFHFSLHRAVAEVYLHPKNLFETQVDHLDGNIMNFHVLNLEWVTPEENIRRAVEARRRKKAALSPTSTSVEKVSAETNIPYRRICGKGVSRN